MARPLVSLLTDFGLRDPSPAICRGVILGIVGDAEIVDVSHEVRKYSIRDGALVLWCALPYLPVGFHVAVVDPGVGTARRPIAIRTGRGDVLLGPDNGLLPGAAERLGGIVEVHLLADPAYRLAPVSTSFHGRDIFAPAAAHLARGVAFADLGPAVDPASLVPSPLVAARVEEGRLETAIVYRDTFGNAKFGALADDLAAAFGARAPGDAFRLALEPAGARPGRVEVIAWRGTFGEAAPGELLLYEDSYGRLCLAEHLGDAVARLGLVDDEPVTLTRGDAEA